MTANEATAPASDVHARGSPAPIDAADPGLPARLQEHLESTGLIPDGAGVTVALSGGLDSVALLSLLLRLHDGRGWRVSAAHFDHRMRPGSGDDADWVARLCADLGCPVEVGTARSIPRTEGQARDLRYAFLVGAREALDSDVIATAHHADDQAETVLFRILRGTGPTGLAGIPPRRWPGIVRPLLPFRRSELEAYVAREGLGHLDDPTNRDLSFARNRIRHVLLPRLEADGAPEVRRRLRRLGRLARLARRALRRFVEDAAAGLILESSERRIVVARSDFLAYDKTCQAYLLRHLVSRFGPRPGRGGTRAALKFMRAGRSGRRIQLRGGVTVLREFDRLIVEGGGEPDAEPDGELVIPDRGQGAGELTVGGRRWTVSWGGEADAVSGEEVAGFHLSDLRFPVTIRAWQPGDRIRLPAGRRKLKKVFGDRRVGRSERGRRPVVADGSGVLWVVGVARSVRARDATPAPRYGERGGEVLKIGLQPER